MNKSTLLIAIATAGTFFASPAPAHLNGMLESVKVSAASHDFASDLSLAQSEAIRRASRIVLCKSADGEQCAASGDWAQGWIVFHDANGNSVREQGEDLIAREPSFSRQLRVAGSVNAVRSVTFDPTGAARLLGTTANTATLTVCRQALQGAEARQVVLRTGRAPEVHRAVVWGCA